MVNKLTQNSMKGFLNEPQKGTPRNRLITKKTHQHSIPFNVFIKVA